MEPILTVQIPTYRNLKQLCDTLSTMVMYQDFPYIIRIINNDGTEEAERELDRIVAGYSTDYIEVIHAHGNRGWMGAHNMALEMCETPFVALMNDDVFFLPQNTDFWHSLIQWFRHDDVGAVGPISNFVMGAQNMWNYQVHTISETTLLIGFCVLMRTEAIKAIGGLDETLPGGDDLDWSIRLRDAGWKLLIDKTQFLFHLGQQTGGKVHGRYWDSQLHQDRTNNALIRKHGVKKWYETLCARHWKFGPPLEKLFNEQKWYTEHAQKHKGQKGLNLGVGHMPIEGVTGLDIAKKGDRGSGGRKFRGAENDMTADATKLPVADKSLDFLMAAHIFEHTLDPIATLMEWRRVLKPGGTLYATLPDHEKIDTMLIDHTHKHAYTPQSFGNLLGITGWEIEFCEQLPRCIGFGVIARKPGRIA